MAELTRRAPAAAEEAAVLQRAYDAVQAARAAGVEQLPYDVAYLFMRLAAHDDLRAMGDLAAVDRRMAERGQMPGGHIVQVARIGPTRADKLAFLDTRRAWGEAVEAAAAREPLSAPASPSPSGKFRLGIVSSDLRQTNVGVFAWPLFEHRDRERFELFVYAAHPGPPDGIQAVFQQFADAWRPVAGSGPRAVAAQVAADGVDMLIDFGEPLAWQVAAYRPARVQATWMGYPSSVGLKAIDRIILDPYLAPSDADLVLEKPLVMPHSSIAMAEAYFEPGHPIAPPPQDRNGVVTFGTLNSPHKYSEACLDLWARVVAAVPGSRFVFVRPEAGAPAFRRNVAAAFARRGVGAARLGFAPVRGDHLRWYGEIDISLDTLPVTGGTTTCESLWMGVPVVSLVGAAIHERLSGSILANAGLADLAAPNEEAFVATAVALAADRERRRTLRAGLRDQIRAHPIGQVERFARDFYDALAAAILAARERTL